MIIGLTDHQAAFPIIGILRKGEEKDPEKNKPGKDLTYFRFVSEDADAYRHFSMAYPDQEALRQINAFLPYKTADENMESWMEHWVAGGLVHRCDGKNCVIWRDESGAYSEKPMPCPGGCSQVGRLSIIVPELGRLATVTVLTTSKWDIINLTRQLRSYEALRGDLRGIPFVIVRRPTRISTPRGNGKRVRAEKWLLSIETQPDWTRLQLNAMAQEALPASIDDDNEDVRIVPENEQDRVNVSNIVAPYDETIQNGNGAPLRKVLSPERLLKALGDKIKAKPYIDGETGEALPIHLHALGEDTAKIIAAKWTEALDGDKGAYHLSLMAAFGQDSAKDLTAGQANAALSWLLNNKNWAFDTPVVEPAPEEAKALYEWAKEQIEKEMMEAK